MLVTLKEILDTAKENKYAVGAFNGTSLEGVRAIIAAAEAQNMPVILQHAESHESLVPITEIGPIMIDYAKRASVPVAVHLDHGASFDMCIKAIRLGFTSIMYDASAKEYETNLKETTEMVRIAHAAGVSVEAELGHIFTSEINLGEGGKADSQDDYDNLNDIYTDPKIAKEFVEATGVDCLAIAFGTVHGVYLTEPKLDLNRVEEISQTANLPLVMHGGSGVSKDDYKTAITNGICKINYYTYMNKAAGKAIGDVVNSKESEDFLFYDELSQAAMEAMKKDVENAIRIFKNN